MRALQNIIKPTIGILTNIGGAHQENFFSLQEKCMEKLALFKNCDVVIYNGDDEFINNCVGKSMLAAREIAWISKFTYSSIVWLGYAFICLGVVDCFWEGHSLLFWTIGFGGFHILYGILFYLHYERKRS